MVLSTVEILFNRGHMYQICCSSISAYCLNCWLYLCIQKKCNFNIYSHSMYYFLKFCLSLIHIFLGSTKSFFSTFAITGTVRGRSTRHFRTCRCREASQSFRLLLSNGPWYTVYVGCYISVYNSSSICSWLTAWSPNACKYLIKMVFNVKFYNCSILFFLVMFALCFNEF